MKKKTWFIFIIAMILAGYTFFKPNTTVVKKQVDTSKIKKFVFRDLAPKPSKKNRIKQSPERNVANASPAEIAKKRKRLVNLRKKLWEKHNKQKKRLQKYIKKHKIRLYNKRFMIEDGLYVLRSDQVDNIDPDKIFKVMGPYTIVELDIPPTGLTTTVIRDVKTLNLGYYSGQVKVVLKNISDLSSLLASYNSVSLVKTFDHINVAIIQVSQLQNANEFVRLMNNDPRVKSANVDIIMTRRRGL